jgi:hypothetical protein
MRGDFSRDTFNPDKHYSRVLQQQGRALVDADWNEQVAILLEQQRSFVRDLLGPHAGVGNEIGFKIGVDTVANRLTIAAGRYYVDGLMCNNPVAHNSEGPLDLSKGRVLVLIDVWERYITSIEDPTIREVSLGGADTATRAKVVWKISVGTVDKVKYPEFKLEHWAQWAQENLNPPKAKMSAQLQPLDAVESDSTALDGSGHRGLGNQLYRVEVHQGSEGSNMPTIKWSRENGSVVTAWLACDGNRLTVESTRGFEVGQWVELLDDRLELNGKPGTLVKVQRVSADVLVVDGTFAMNQFNEIKMIRRWDHVSSSTAIAVKKGEWIDLENGIQIQFDSLNQFNTGDYWLMPARGSTGSIDWPVDPKMPGQPMFLPPHGVAHHYAPLALITAVKEVADLRQQLTVQVQQIP